MATLEIAGDFSDLSVGDLVRTDALGSKHGIPGVVAGLPRPGGAIILHPTTGQVSLFTNRAAIQLVERGSRAQLAEAYSRAASEVV